jgi:hypothetical protein
VRQTGHAQFSNTIWIYLGVADTSLLNAYQPPDLASEQVVEVQNLVSSLAKEAGMDQLPEF